MSTSYKKVVCVGIGGGAMFYVAKYLNFLGVEVSGFDINKTDRTAELENLGIKIAYNNPTAPFPKDTDLIVYSNALPKDAIEKITLNNRGTSIISVDGLYEGILESLDSDSLNEEELIAVRKADLASLYEIDTSGVVMIGVTGTDGKTTTTEMIASILEHAGYKVGLINTVSARIGDKEKDTGFHVTTPSAQENAGYLKEMLASGCTHIIMECTSHGLKTGRLAGLKFDFAVYTNITPEHLDFHKSIGDLITAKSYLITKHLKQNGWAVLNADDANVLNNMGSLSENQILYSRRGSAHVTAYQVSPDEEGVCFAVGVKEKRFRVRIPMIGEYNVSNALASICVAAKLKINTQTIQKGLTELRQIPGRTQVLQKSPFMVIVDFAHTPNGLENVLRSVKPLSTGRLIAVFGCAGKRDASKRPLMGEVAAKYADITILTAEDPRSESLSDINDEIESGWKKVCKEESQLVRFDDDTQNVKVRKDAIKKALDLAGRGDTVIVCGKSHEKSLCFGNTEYSWNDIEEVRKLLIN